MSIAFSNSPNCSYLKASILNIFEFSKSNSDKLLRTFNPIFFFPSFIKKSLASINKEGED